MWKNREDYYDRHHLIPRNPKEEKEAHGLSVDENVIKINMGKMVTMFCGRNLSLKCLDADSLVITGFIISIEFIT